MQPLRSPALLAIVVVTACTGPDPTAPDASPPDARPIAPGFTLGEPIVLDPADLGRWVWIAMPEMACADGTPGGFAVNFTGASRDLVFYLQGGGICYDQITCAASGAATSVGDDPLTTALDGSIRDHQGIFDRSDPDNPFRDSNYVVVPHCTGDHHTGYRVTTHGGTTFHHVGYANITRALERVVPTFADGGRVVLTGFSAGGVGITANYHQLASAFASVGQPPPYLVIDAGPFMRPPYLTTTAQEMLREAWNLDGTVGTFCDTCFTSGFHELYRVNGELHSGLRSSLICTYEDSVVRLLYSVLNGETFEPDRMREGLADLADWGETTLASSRPSQHRVFYFDGERHGALQGAPLSAVPGLVEFLNGQLGTGDWPSVRS